MGTGAITPRYSIILYSQRLGFRSVVLANFWDARPSHAFYCGPAGGTEAYTILARLQRNAYSRVMPYTLPFAFDADGFGTYWQLVTGII